MPEGPEVKIASKYFNTFFKNSCEIQFEILTEYYKENYMNVFAHIEKNLHRYNPSYTIGKNIFIDLEDNTVFNFHLGMTGGWFLEPIKHCHFRVFNKSKELFFRDVRKFGKMRIIDKKTIIKKHHAQFDLLNINYNFKKHIKFLSNEISHLKTTCSILMNQKYFPGVGNYIKSEALFAAKIHPEEKWQNLTNKEKSNLILQTKDIMERSYKFGGAELRDFKNPAHKSQFKLHIYGRRHTDKKNKITSYISSDQRRTWICEKYQKLKALKTYKKLN